MRKFITYSFSLVMLLTFSTSCVSKKKYTQAQDHIERLQQDSAQYVHQINALQDELAQVRGEFTEYKSKTEDQMTSMMAQLEQQGTELSEKDQALQERAQRLRALQDRLQEQQRIVENLRKTIEDALVNIEDEDLSVEVKNGKVYVSLSDKLLFPSGSANLNEEGKEAIGKVGQVLRQNPKINIDVVGHTDSIPINTPKYRNNWELSTARATTITKLLTDEHNIDGSRLTASGMSEYNPVASNKDREGRAKNRRTEIILTPKLEELFKILEGDGSGATTSMADDPEE